MFLSAANTRAFSVTSPRRDIHPPHRPVLTRSRVEPRSGSIPARIAFQRLHATSVVNPSRPSTRSAPPSILVTS